MKTFEEIRNLIGKLKEDIDHAKKRKIAIGDDPKKPEERKYYDLLIELSYNKIRVLEWVLGEDVFI